MKKIMTLVVLTSLTTAIASDGSASDEFSRAGKWEVYGFGQAMKIFDLLTEDADVFGGGLGLGYNLSQHFTVNADFSASAVKTDYELLFTTITTTERTTLYLGTVSLDYNILMTRVTPLITAGVGFGSFATGESGVSFDPSLGAGVRWDVSDRFLVKAILRATYWDATDTSEAAIGFSLAAGYKF